MPTIKEIESLFDIDITIEPQQLAKEFLYFSAKDQCEFFNHITDDNSVYDKGFETDVRCMIEAGHLDEDGINAIAMLHDAILAEKSKLRPKEPETKFKVGDVVYSFHADSSPALFKGVITDIDHKSSSGERWYKFKTERMGDTLYTCDSWAYHSVDEALLESAKRAGY